ncbi:MAG: isoamylase early set domain-containing protein [Candidatus Omnitrophica bacterium]|nr:isoamylase early set domain-containing protein [Candidatus Omnitrophota bacterium]
MPREKAYKPKSGNQLKKETVFEFYAPLAQKVAVAGTFNDWDIAQYLLKKGAEGRWSLKIELKPGRYEYRYLVDGSWQNDQRPAVCVPNAFGTWNCVIEVS